MKLADLLISEGLTYSAFAHRIGSAHARTVERYAKGLQRPNAAMMEAIARETGGRVTPNDFFDLSDVLSERSA
jgi:transcriptional regulator with XRE-family HTH domain